MTLSMYQASVPVFIHGLNNLSAILGKAGSYADSKKIDPSVFIQGRLAPDMFPLSRQIQIATDISRRGLARLASVEAPSFEDTETTIAQLQERIAKTITYFKTFQASQIDGTEGKDITLKIGTDDMHFKGQDYLIYFVIPNFYFHLTTSYAILRHNGVDIGKKDFLGSL